MPSMRIDPKENASKLTDQYLHIFSSYRVGQLLRAQKACSDFELRTQHRVLRRRSQLLGRIRISNQNVPPGQVAAGS